MSKRVYLMMHIWYVLYEHLPLPYVHWRTDRCDNAEYKTGKITLISKHHTIHTYSIQYEYCRYAINDA